jgi:hypothetical protein
MMLAGSEHGTSCIEVLVAPNPTNFILKMTFIPGTAPFGKLGIV